MTNEKDWQERYKRHILLPEIGVEGQKRINAGRVLVVGAGGLGSPVMMYLAAAGVGTIGVIDGDRVDMSNLQRQIIHGVNDVGRLKVESARDRIAEVNPEVNVVMYREFLDEGNAARIMEDYDFIVDATDSFGLKMLINDTCVAVGKPFSHGGISGFGGQTMTYVPGSASYRCLFDSEPVVSEVRGPFGAVPGIIGSVQAAEAIKYLAGVGELLTDRLLIMDALSMSFTVINISK
ncbi:MAG: HesA/MoeB/ThiF family protein [Muribaculaceae bacterium]|nr:HesA/MoeB/ThiF family protein [Muribaculaceae bacterium]